MIGRMTIAGVFGWFLRSFGRKYSASIVLPSLTFSVTCLITYEPCFSRSFSSARVGAVFWGVAASNPDGSGAAARTGFSNGCEMQPEPRIAIAAKRTGSGPFARAIRDRVKLREATLNADFTALTV